MTLAGLNTYFIGIGGCGMSGLAQLFKARGSNVSGSDNTQTPITKSLLDAGFAVNADQHAGVIPEGTDLVVATAAIPDDHPELQAARAAGIETRTYAQALGLAMNGHTGVAIAGTHGKSTTTAMLGVALAHAGIDPSVIVGATVPQLSADPAAPPAGFRVGAQHIPTGPRKGDPGVLIAEACEYTRSFENLTPTVAAITSVEADHLDYFGSIDAYVDAFRSFASLLPSYEQGGKLLIAHDGAHRREVSAGATCAVRTIGFAPSADYHITVTAGSGGPRGAAAKQIVRVAEGRRSLGSFTLSLPGEHMAFNAAVALVLGTWLGADPQELCAGLSRFQGLDRRLQRLGEVRAAGASQTLPRITVYDDYGHHPTEIDATLRALREFERPEEHGGRLVCVFQPHQHSRTRFLLDEFAASFSSADVVIVPEIYFVRDSEMEKAKVRSSDLVAKLRAKGVKAMHLSPFDAIVEQLPLILGAGDVLVVMGAGPVWQVGRDYINHANEAASA